MLNSHSIEGRTVVVINPTSITLKEAPQQITIPDVRGQNARVALKALEKLGLTDVDLSSANPKYQNVFNPSNWTVVSIEPAPGSAVSADDPVVLKVYKD